MLEVSASTVGSNRKGRPLPHKVRQAITDRNQHVSPFLQLSIEIRYMVYHLALGGKVIYVRPRHGDTSGKSKEVLGALSCFLSNPKPIFDAMALHLPAVCRQISLELGKNFVFRFNTFMVNSYFAPSESTLPELIARLGKDQRNSIEVLGLINYHQSKQFALDYLPQDRQEDYKELNQFRNLKRLVVNTRSEHIKAVLKEWTANHFKKIAGNDGLIVEFDKSDPRFSCVEFCQTWVEKMRNDQRLLLKT
jgi:hypothetical protein